MSGDYPENSQRKQIADYLASSLILEINRIENRDDPIKQIGIVSNYLMTEKKYLPRLVDLNSAGDHG